jgi:cytochrome P450
MLQSVVPLKQTVDFAYDDVVDLHDILDELRTHGPVVPVRYLGGTVWLILAHRELNQAFNDLEHFDPAEGYSLIAAPSQGRTIQTMAGEEHRVSRAMVVPPFLPNKVRSYVDALIEPVAHEILDRIEGEAEVDFVQAFARPFPFTIITRLLSIPVSDEALLLEWAVKLIDFPWDPEGALRAKNEFDAYMQHILADRRCRPGSDFISSLVTAEFDGQKLDDERIMAFFRLLFPAGSDTTYKNAGSLFACVLADPELKAAALRSERERDAIVTEALRWQPPTALLPRMASADTELGGVQIRKGDWLLFGITAANSDPQVFPEPRRFDPARDNREIITFGRGVHFCLGMHLARRELEVALRVVLERFPGIRLAPGRHVEFVGGVLRGPRELWVQPRDNR